MAASRWQTASSVAQIASSLLMVIAVFLSTAQVRQAGAQVQLAREAISYSILDSLAAEGAQLQHHMLERPELLREMSPVVENLSDDEVRALCYAEWQLRHYERVLSQASVLPQQELAALERGMTAAFQQCPSLHWCLDVTSDLWSDALKQLAADNPPIYVADQQ